MTDRQIDRQRGDTKDGLLKAVGCGVVIAAILAWYAPAPGADWIGRILGFATLAFGIGSAIGGAYVAVAQAAFERGYHQGFSDHSAGRRYDSRP